MRTQSIIILQVCFLLAGLTAPTIACPPDCDDCETWNNETKTCDWDCTTDQCCDGGSCVDDCPTGSCCNDSCCDSGNCCNGTTCCPNSDDVCCTDSGSYCCESGKTCCQGSCCTAGQCCDDGTCVDDCPTGECCDEGKCEPMEMDSVTSNKASACVGCDITFTATTDPTGYEDDVEWSGGGEPATGSGATFTTHWDTSGTKTVTAELCDSEESKQVTIVKVDKVVESGTTDEGPIYVCPDDTVSLEAKPNPSDASFPSGEPHWSIQSQPEGASASLSSSSGSATTTLSGLTKLGEYVIKAQCGDSDSGDTIIVSTAPTSGYWVNFVPYFSCPRLIDPDCNLEWRDDVSDVCTNMITITCFPGECFYKYFFNGVEVGRCPWPDAHNQFWYKISLDDKQFLETKHTSGNNENSSSGAGCDGYYCWRTEKYDCLNKEPIDEGVWWERWTSPVFKFGSPTPGHYEACPGPTGGGPHPFWPD